MDINRFHRAPTGFVVYQPLDKKRVLQLIDQKRTMPFQASLQHLYMMLVKGEYPVRKKDFIDISLETYKFFMEQPTWKDIGPNTHYVIIGGQHCEATHRVLVREGSLSEEDERDATNFIITIVCANPKDWNLMLYYSRVLNQDLVGVRLEGNYLIFLEVARRKWVTARCLAPSKNGLAHLNEFKVSP